MKNILLMSCGKSNYFVRSFNNYIERNSLNYNLIGMDNNKKSKFFKYLNNSIKSPQIKSKSFNFFFFNLIKRFKVDFIIPFNDPDLKYLKDNFIKVSKYSKILTPNKRLIDYGLDKVKTKKLLKKLSLKYPQSFIFDEIREDNFPIIHKGRGKNIVSTKGFTVIKNQNDFLKVKYDKNFILEKQIKGQEYTVDIISNYKKNFNLILPMQRIKTKNIVSVKAKFENNNRIIKQAKKILSFFKVVGFVNFQCFIDDKNKKIYWTDLNLRISGGIDFAIQSNPYFLKH